MPRLRSTVIGAALITLFSASPLSADCYSRHAKPCGAPPELVDAPGNEAVVDVTVRYRGLPAYGYGPAFVPRPPSLWRQREVAYDAIFTPDKRIIYDAGRAAQSRAAAEYYKHQPNYYYRAPAYGPVNGYAPVEAIGPIIDPAGTCGTFRYWDGTKCVDARYHSRYKNPFRWYGLHK